MTPILGQVLGLLALAAFCAVWVLIASRRRKVRLTACRRNLERAVAREIARTHQPARIYGGTR